MARWRITLLVDADDRHHAMLLRGLVRLYSTLRNADAEVSVKVERECDDV